MVNLIKYSGQVFTPDYLVKIILDEAGYYGSEILQKHCIDNSCGDGAFLLEIVRRYTIEYRKVHSNSVGLSEELSKFIHGIEIEDTAYRCCLENLNHLAHELQLNDVKFDVRHCNAISFTEFDEKMDFVIGNPPYVRVHNLNDSYSDVKRYSFASDGMTDLYLVFFELGFKMLKTGGKLCYITPSSWLNSLAGTKLRNYIRQTRSLISLTDLAHFQAFKAFKATTYTLISNFVKGFKSEEFTYNTFDEQSLSIKFESVLSYSDIDINGCFYLADKVTLQSLQNIFSSSTPKYVSVKNGFATLADKIFISPSFPFTQFVIPVIKASTGKWYQAFFPYDKKGKAIDKTSIFSDSSISSYLNNHKTELLKDTTEANNPYWFLYGRTQALKDVFLDKLAVNTTIKDIESIKINFVPSGSGIYSGLYIITETDIDLNVVSTLLNTSEFVKYIASLKKYKSGGYYTYNSKDLESYLNYHIDKLIKNETVQISSLEQCGLFSNCG